MVATAGSVVFDDITHSDAVRVFAPSKVVLSFTSSNRSSLDAASDNVFVIDSDF